jgi:hypothetical protein
MASAAFVQVPPPQVPPPPPSSLYKRCQLYFPSSKVRARIRVRTRVRTGVKLVSRGSVRSRVQVRAAPVSNDLL